MKEYKFTIEYTVSCGNFSRSKTEIFTVEHDNPLTAWQPLHSYCVDLNRSAKRGGCTLKLIAKDENDKTVLNWK